MTVDYVRKADSFAALAHMGQWRVDALGPACGTPYIEHPRNVRRWLLEAHPDPELHTSMVQQIALLHRVLWRASVDPAQLEAVFGRDVAAGVRMLSPWIRARPETRKEEDTYWPRLPRAPRVLRAVVATAWLDDLDVAERWPDAFDLDQMALDVAQRVLPLVHDDPWLAEMLAARVESLLDA